MYANVSQAVPSLRILTLKYSEILQTFHAFGRSHHLNIPDFITVIFAQEYEL
jgi:hypothetical protein